MLRIKEARNGKGLFTTTKLNKNDFVFKVVGQKVHFEKLLEIEGDSLNNSFRYSLNYYLMPSKKDLAYFINHSCEPNVRIVRKNNELEFRALHDISASDEIVFDYSTILAKDDIWTMKCNCGASCCRKTIKRYDRLPKKVLSKYLDEKMIPGYILKLG
ncbi:MAG: SET domain-containing protein-lysine N-methyltransferase [Candidatus Pacebacteria bacterium]|nr:SET domain-containing protein-lysine N-methyltransferase [Candidatus Paceibacterota bacterium]MBP9780442.1 SET domain-containing protein-lysine N-methyltransferase [Candidatus Paceibacterota bacterium]